MSILEITDLIQDTLCDGDGAGEDGVEREEDVVGLDGDDA